jgi:hypothetical protein
VFARPDAQPELPAEALTVSPDRDNVLLPQAELAVPAAAGRPERGDGPHRAASTARRNAARANRRVESSVGSGELLSLMIRGISVQPRITASQ